MTDIKCIAAFDLATHCGWCLWHKDKDKEADDLTSGVWNMSLKPHESSGMRIVAFGGHLNRLLQTYPDIQMIVWEDVQFVKHRLAYKVHCELAGKLQEWAINNKLEHTGVSVGEIKRFATGKGNASKDMMMAAARLRWAEYSFADDNEVDARWLMETTLNRYQLRTTDGQTAMGR